MHSIRAGRKKPGLLRQHLTAVKAAGEIGRAIVNGDNINSLNLVFEPRDIISGDYHFSIGTAGSATLVLQTVLPALIFGRHVSTLTLEGGTHNPYAPPFDFLKNSFLSCLGKMGVKTDCTLKRYGFYPAGGGEFHIQIQPVKRLNPLEITERGNVKRIDVVGLVSEIPVTIAEDEVKIILSGMNWDTSFGKALSVTSPGPGNIVFIKLEYENICEVFTGFGQRGVSRQKVAEKVLQQTARYLDTGVPVGEYLSDQLLIPLALAGIGRFRTCTLTNHTLTNIEIIKKFLGVNIVYKESENSIWEIQVEGKPHHEAGEK